MSFRGNLLAESLRKEASFDAVPLTVRRIYRADDGDPSADQPLTWTFIEFELPDHRVDVFAEALTDALERGPWYCDFRSAEETFVVFADRVFRYPRDDQSAREEAEGYARSVGVPEEQIDWPA